MNTNVEQILEIIEDVVNDNKRMRNRIEDGNSYGAGFCEGSIDSLNDVRNQIIEMFGDKK